MYNKVQQKFDRSIRDAVEETKRANERKPRRVLKPIPDEPRRAIGKHVLVMDPETGGTVLVPYDHPLAEAKRRQKRASADTLCRISHEWIDALGKEKS